ncbi:hypothetical protein EYE40_09830 [Glaciihabitans arcticus]|uniref:Uncharacterized protein n=1 Tax=Glaciihabitans arcticus TaxID=2668039 RepID=A0A4Q9GY12_9MICO|nr:hypothetical protein [Glaciihabitans arcticus]TBN57663.1 hypothetical protein EYE40_09830 [Glaciihabitans arcticus]
MTLKLASVIPVWILAIIGAILVATLADRTSHANGFFAGAGGYLDWLGIVFAILVILTFVVQLLIQRSEGFVSRVVASIVGSLLILAVATAFLVFLPH